jgi:peroxidase
VEVKGKSKFNICYWCFFFVLFLLGLCHHLFDLSPNSKNSQTLSINDVFPISLSHLSFYLDSGTGREFGIPKQQVNKVTGWLDLSVVYGSADERAAAISSPKNGKIDMQDDGKNLAYNVKGIANLNLLGKKIERLVISGDNRVNVQPGLLTHHTLWAREHNRIVDELLVKNPTMTDRDLFLLARKQNIATYQHIVMYEWLPLLLGPLYIRKHKLSTYKAGGQYDSNNIDARVANEFASVAFRFGHSQVTDTLKRLNDDLKPSKYGHLNLRDNYFSPGRVMKQGGLDPILRGMIWTASQEVDTKAVDGVRNFLFGTNTKGFDLVAINIQRGRDHGIPDYNTLRQKLGLTAKLSYSEITSNAEVASQLEELYGKEGYNDMDAFVGGLAEDHVEDGTIGELFAHIIADQFYRLRNGDRHWYENIGVNGNEKLMEKIKGVTIAQVIERNSHLGQYDKVWDGHHAGDRSAFLIPEKNERNRDEL